jgi:hypothetical protein
MVSQSALSLATAVVNGEIRPNGGIGVCGIVYGTNSFTAGLGIRTNATNLQNADNSALQAPELWLPHVELTVEQQRNFLANPVRSLLFTDFRNGDPLSAPVPAGGKFTMNLGNYPSAKRIWMLLETPPSHTIGNIPVHQQCLSSEGFYSSPDTSIRDVQITVGGSTVYDAPIQYDYQMYVQNSKPNLQGALCGDSVSYGQGIYSLAAWERSPIYCFNVDQKVIAGTGLSITLTATNSSNQPINHVVFVEVLKQVEVKVDATRYTITTPAESV